MKTNYSNFDELYEPVWDYRSPEEQAEAIARAEKEEEQPAQIPEEPQSEVTGTSEVLNMKTEDGSPVILVQQVTRDSGINTPKATLKRAFHSVTGFIGFIVAAVVVSILASVIYNTIFNGLSLDRALATIFPFLQMKIGESRTKQDKVG